MVCQICSCDSQPYILVVLAFLVQKQEAEKLIENTEK